MPWTNGDTKLLREEFCHLALQQGTNFSHLCRQFNVSRKTGYKWMKRARERSHPSFADRSKRPHHLTFRISQTIKEKIITARCLHPHWGAKKIKALLLNQKTALTLPSISTINKILAQAELMRIHQHERHTPYKRFEHAYPNALWQMDFKGYFSLLDGNNSHPLTILDDYSRYLLCLAACPNEQLESVKDALIKTFTRYGLPDALVLDNGSCWKPKNKQKWSELTVWLMRLGINIIHGKFYHPQSRGKDERLHRTLKLELINDISMKNLADCQYYFDLWRHTYNHIRPHEALELQPPVTRYQTSKRHFSQHLPPIQYWEDDTIRHVDKNGHIHLAGKSFLLNKALRGYPVALRPSLDGTKLNIFFCQQKVKAIQMPECSIKPGKKCYPSL
jgi:transposase InsO family protein